MTDYLDLLQQLMHVLGLLSDQGRPVMLLGPDGCGKSSIINERIRTVCSGEVAEVLSLTIQANRFILKMLIQGPTLTQCLFRASGTQYTMTDSPTSFLSCIRFTNARLMFERLDERLEWKHGSTYVPKGNKRLMCFVDDLNLAQVICRLFHVMLPS